MHTHACTHTHTQHTHTHTDAASIAAKNQYMHLSYLNIKNDQTNRYPNSTLDRKLMNYNSKDLDMRTITKEHI